MKPILKIALCATAAITMSVQASSGQGFVTKGLKRAQVQSALMDTQIEDVNKFPSSLDTDGSIKSAGVKSWISGFYPGDLWMLYGYTGDKKWEEMARRHSAPIDQLRHYTKTHDLGFMVGCPLLAAYSLTNDSEYRQIIIDASDALISRFNPTVGLIRSWDNKGGAANPYRVIIDNMMNLEMLFKASEFTGDKKYYDIAVTHANTTLKNHFRADNSAYHIICYDVNTGKVLDHQGGQGYSNTSSWSRGQSWGLYGFTMCYRFTHDERYLDRAKKSADYLINHRNMPDDMVPYWDYYAPGIPNEPRDASAAALMASALLELAEYVPQNAALYRKTAKKILRSLSSDKYLIAAGDKHGFIVDHSTGAKPNNSQVDVPIIYGDYYYIEALLRLKNIKNY